jgi:hypothetical protein
MAKPSKMWLRHLTLAAKTYRKDFQCPALLFSACDSVTEIILKNPHIQFMRAPLVL